MSETLNFTELPHQFLLRKYSINPQVLNDDGKQMISDLQKTIRLVEIQSKQGKLNLTDAISKKITTYDRYICDSIFEYLEEEEKATETEIEESEEAMHFKREEVEDKMEDMQKEQLENKEISTEENKEISTEENQVELEQKKNKDQPETKEKSDILGFWDWE